MKTLGYRCPVELAIEYESENVMEDVHAVLFLAIDLAPSLQITC